MGVPEPGLRQKTPQHSVCGLPMGISQYARVVCGNPASTHKILKVNCYKITTPAFI